MYFTPDLSLKKYYCIEIDSRGLFLDYSSSFHRNFDFSFSFPKVNTAASLTPNGYTIEGSIPLNTLRQLNVLQSNRDNIIFAGLYRAQINTGQHSEDLYKWISWIDPQPPPPISTSPKLSAA